MPSVRPRNRFAVSWRVWNGWVSPTMKARTSRPISPPTTWLPPKNCCRPAGPTAASAPRRSSMPSGRRRSPPKQALGYDRTCRNLTPQQVAEKEAAGLPSVIRFKVPDRQGLLGYDDKVMGRIECDYREVDDFAHSSASNGKPLYLLSTSSTHPRSHHPHHPRSGPHDQHDPPGPAL